MTLAGLLDLLLPAVCPACGEEPGAELCQACHERLVPITRPCPRCATPLPETSQPCVRCQGRGLDGLQAISVTWAYRDNLTTLVHAAKDRGCTGAIRALVSLLQHLPAPPADAVLCPVPPAKRGGRPKPHLASHLCRQLARTHQRPCRQLVCYLRTPMPQHQLRERERRQNLRQTFACRGPVPERVLLVDDILTTGSTLQAVARCLREGGCRHVSAYCLARTPDPRDPGFQIDRSEI